MNEKPRLAHPVVLIVVGLPAIAYQFMTRALWGFPGCPPESLEYPGHPAPSTPREGSLVLIACIWVWFAACAGASVGVHRRLRAQPERWLRVASFVLPAAVSIGAPILCLAFVALATLC